MSNSSPTPPFFDVRMRGFPSRSSVEDAVRLIRQRTSTLGSERISSQEAHGRVLVSPIIAPVSVPHFDRAAFDGYAVRAADANPRRIIGEALPGRPHPGTDGPGEAVRIMTGSPMPPGADAVLPVEWSSETDEGLVANQPIEAGRNVGRVGEDVPEGRTVLNPGRVLRPQDLGLLSSLGVREVEAVRRPRVAILITGEEILPPGSRPEGFQIVDSNSVVLRALVARDGGLPLPTRHLPDDPDLIRSCMSERDWDVLLVSGGTSVGREDHAPRLVAELGELPIHGVALRPASPTGVGFIGNRPVFLLPGNPAACLCAYDLFAGMAIRPMGGRSEALPYRTVERPVAKRLGSVLGRVDCVRVIDRPEGIEPVPTSGASILSSTVIADGFVMIPPEIEEYAVGERISVYLYD